RVILFFPGAPIHIDADGRPQWDAAPTARLFRHLVRSLAREAKAGRVIFAAETHPMVRALSALSGVQFTYLPHPVALPEDTAESAPPADAGDILLGSYGSARHEKGPDILFAAVEKHLAAHPDTRLRFALQVVGCFTDSWKRLAGHPRVDIIEDFFPPGEYPRQLARTHGLILPYRTSSYALRVSRVVIEAMVGGFPLIATDHTTLSDQAAQFGAGVFCENENVESLAAAIRQLEEHFQSLRTRAWDRRRAAREHFSVATFRQLLAGSAGPEV
ncbi:MAG: glycosyltransferase, partial [Verrucomicrobia bacterium]